MIKPSILIALSCIHIQLYFHLSQAFAPLYTTTNNAIITLSTKTTSTMQSTQQRIFTNHPPHTQTTTSTTKLFNSLKPAAIPLMDSGKALARSGELLIDLTSQLDLYGGGLSAAGANIRNCGDCLAQAGASCRMKTATELVIDELREGSDCLREGTDKLDRALEECTVDGDVVLRDKIERMIVPMKQASLWIEECGAAILRREKLEDVVAGHLISAGEALLLLSMSVEGLDENSPEGKLSAQRMGYASEQMILAGNELKGEKKKPMGKGKAWIKG